MTKIKDPQRAKVTNGAGEVFKAVVLNLERDERAAAAQVVRKSFKEAEVEAETAKARKVRQDIFREGG